MISLDLRFVGSVSLVALAFGALGCASTQTTRYGRNGWRITCGENMSSCAGRADTVCGDKGYTVVGGGTQSTTLGGSTGYQTKTRMSELIVRCGEAGAEGSEESSEEPVEGTFKLPPRSDEAPAVAPAAPAPAPAAPVPAAAPKLSCVPGETQKCIGPGACEGGQACLADGSAFGACDCGGAPGTPAAPAAPESSTWSSGGPAPTAAPAPAATPGPTPAPAAPAKRP
jgi:hypothetical protein